MKSAVLLYYKNKLTNKNMTLAIKIYFVNKKIVQNY